MVVYGILFGGMHPINTFWVGADSVLYFLELDSSMVEPQLMVWWVFRSIPHGGPTELFLIPTSVPQLV